MHTDAFQILLLYYHVNHRPRFFHYSLGIEVEKNLINESDTMLTNCYCFASPKGRAQGARRRSKTTTPNEQIVTSMRKKYLSISLLLLLLERFSNDCRKTKTKTITPTNHNRNK